MAKFFQENYDFIGHGLTLIGIIVGVVIVAWQQGRQHRSSLKLQRDNAREELKLKIYEILNERVKQLGHCIMSASTYAFMIPFSIKSYQLQLTYGIASPQPKERALELNRLHNETVASLIRVLEEFEAWSIAFPGFKLFQTALSSANHDAWEAFNQLFPSLVKTLPVDPSDDAPPNTPRPIAGPILDKKQLQELEVLIDKYKKAMDVMVSYVIDLRVEAQNNLLSGLFEHRVSGREPLDTTMKVISTSPEKASELMKYFKEETAWGKEMVIIEPNLKEARKE